MAPNASVCPRSLAQMYALICFTGGLALFFAQIAAGWKAVWLTTGPAEASLRNGPFQKCQVPISLSTRHVRCRANRLVAILSAA
jgi:hypothetical protein